MNKVKEENILTLVSGSKKNRNCTAIKDSFVLSNPITEARLLDGLKITKVKFQKKEYLVKANKYLLLIIFRYIVESNLLDVENDVPIKTQSTNKRFLINSEPFHPNGDKMDCVLNLKYNNVNYYIESKLGTKAIHNACYFLLQNYKIPFKNLQVHYTRERAIVSERFKKQLKDKGYCTIDASSLTSNVKSDEIEKKSVVIKKSKKLIQLTQQEVSNRKKSDKRNYIRFNKQDEYYTPSILVEPIVKYIPEGSTIWCPFDTKDSEFVRTFKRNNYNVIHSHIWQGQDFFEYQPKEYDYIISNPPFSKKLEVLDRLYKLNKPFAMVLGLPILNYQNVGNFFVGKDLQLLLLDKKVSFNGKTSSFNNSYFCRNILPKDLIFEHLEHNNSNKHFDPSKMYEKQSNQFNQAA